MVKLNTETMRTTRGNILFLILLAVVLFAALAYAVTSSMRGGGKSASDESAQAIASAVINYGGLLEQTVQRLLMSNDCKETQLSFENTPSGGVSYTNPSAPSKCKIFNSEGGGVSWQDPPSGFALSGEPYYFTLAPIVNLGAFQENSSTNRCINLVGDERAKCVDLIMVVLNISEPVCHAINKMAGITYGATMPDDMGVEGKNLPFNGTFLNRGHDDIGIWDATSWKSVLNNKPMGCYRNSTGRPWEGKYIFWYALLAR